MVGKFICKIEMVRRKAQLKSEVESVVPYTVVQEITAHCERVLGKHSFRSCKSDEVVVMVFLHYATHEKDMFASIECDFGLAHTNFNHDFYTVLQCTQEWGETKFPMGTLEEHNAAKHKYVCYASLQHTTGLCDSKVFLCQ